MPASSFERKDRDDLSVLRAERLLMPRCHAVNETAGSDQR
jgi:hypothetical protein